MRSSTLQPCRTGGRGRRLCSGRAPLRVSAALASPPSLLVVGCGVLGSAVAALWQQRYPGARVVAQTNTGASAERMRSLGLEHRTRADALASAERFDRVLFCAPPSGSADYGGEVALAAREFWSRRGPFVFTSSTAVYVDANTVDERSPTHAPGTYPRADPLLKAEAAARAAGGAVLRLAGLYSLRRGAHSYFLAQRSVPAHGDGLVNLLSYDDAAAGCVAALSMPGAPRDAPDAPPGGDSAAQQPAWAGATWLLSDGAPTSRRDIVNACLRSGLFVDAPASAAVGAGGGGEGPEWTGAPAAGGDRVVECSATRAALGWAPSHASFAQYLESQPRG